MYQSFDFTQSQPVESSDRIPDSPWRLHRLVTTSLFDLELLNSSREEVARLVVESAAAGSRAQIGFINAHCVNLAAQNRAYRAALGTCDHLLPDGSGMRLAAKLAGKSYGENLNGTDLFPLICEQAAARGVAIYLLGGKPGVAVEAGLNMIRRYPGLRIAGAMHGYFDSRDTDRVFADINDSGAAIIFVGFGVPLQECWLADHGGELAVPVQLAVGGLFDYYSGRIPRAPMAVRRLGCEWAWRLAQEPSRLARRYLLGNGAFVVRAMLHALEARSGFALGAACKRAGDFAAVLLGLIILAPLLLAIALAIKIEDRGPVFFTQTRIGKDAKPFRLFKFRSMVVDAERVRQQLETQSDRDGVCFKMRRDPRITRVGALLRRTSVDELPQLINVLLGHMSLVGPRPALPKEVVAYWDRALHRLNVRPGITCIWQVSGRAEIPFDQQVEMDIDYVEDHGVLRDLWLLLRTIPAVATGRGAY